MDKDNMRKTSGANYMPKTANATFLYGGEIAFLAKTNTEASVEITNQKTEKRGGQENQIIGTIFADKAVNVSFTAVDWQPEFLAAQEGTTIEIGKQKYHVDDMSLVVTADLKLQMDKVPADKIVFVKNGDAYKKFSVGEDGSVDVSALGVPEGTCVKGWCMMEGAGKRIGIGIKSIPLIGQLILTAPVFNGTKGKVGTSEYDFPQFQFDGNFTQSFTADASYQLKGSAIADESTVCGEGAVYGEYREVYFEEEDVMTFASIVAAPSIVELAATGKQKLQVFGSKGALYGKTALTAEDGVVFATDKPDIATVTKDGEITAVAEGTAKVTATYKGLTAAVDVTVTA